MTDHGKVERDRIAEALDSLDAAEPDSSDLGVTALVQTFAETVYPTAPGAFYACHVIDPDGTETEGSAAAFNDTGAIIHVYNLGTQIPPASTYLLAHQCGTRWMMRYDG